jgi:4-amino-4-deoxychorismate lyase
MSVATLVDGVATTSLPLDDRGLAYGDGVFETVLVADGTPVWWERHLRRLQRGCAALEIPAPRIDLLQAEATQLAAGAAHALLKITITRGAAARGYAPPRDARARRILARHPAPAPDPRAHGGIMLRWCRMPLALQPRLAGIKHLNRLEQVLARSEWDDAGIAEGLMCDTQGRVVSATAANLFVVRDGRLATPSLQQCGVEGTCREWLLERAEVQVRELQPDDVLGADELFICSSVRGILPVARLDGRDWDVGPMTRRWQQALWDEVAALCPRMESGA